MAKHRGPSPLKGVPRKPARYPIAPDELILSPEDDDLRYASGKWRHMKNDPRGYVQGNGTRPHNNMTMHRLVAERMLGRPLAGDEEVDHINQILDDNRRENLRVVSHHANKQNNAKTYKRKSVGIRGVYPSANGKRWVAHAHETSDGTKRHRWLGTFDTIEEAAEVFEAYKRTLPGYVPLEARP
jgi:hypothetical protein